jgi:hypothetical protein
VGVREGKCVETTLRPGAITRCDGVAHPLISAMVTTRSYVSSSIQGRILVKSSAFVPAWVTAGVKASQQAA